MIQLIKSGTKALLLSLTVSVVFSACGGGGGSSSSGGSGSSNTAVTKINGTVAEGPVKDATITVKGGNGLTVTGASTKTRSDGTYTIEVPADTVLPWKLEVGTDGIDTVTNEKITTPLTTLVTTTAQTTANASTISTLVTQAAESAAGGDLSKVKADDVKTMATQVTKNFGFGVDAEQSDIDIFETPISASNAASFAMASEALGEMVRRVANAASGTGGATISQANVFKALAEDMSDGKVDGQKKVNGVTAAVAITSDNNVAIDTSKMMATIQTQSAQVSLEAITGQLTVTMNDGTSKTAEEVKTSMKSSVASIVARAEGGGTLNETQIAAKAAEKEAEISTKIAQIPVSSTLKEQGRAAVETVLNVNTGGGTNTTMQSVKAIFDTLVVGSTVESVAKDNGITKESIAAGTTILGQARQEAVAIATTVKETASFTINLNHPPRTKDNSLNLTLSPSASISATLPAEDIDGDALTYAFSPEDLPGKGTVSMNNTATGSFTYTARDLPGMDKFSFTVTDTSNAISQKAWVNVLVKNPAVQNQPPLVSSQPLQFTVTGGMTLTGGLRGYDPEGKLLNFSITVNPSVGSVTLGTATLTGGGTLVPFTYVPNPTIVSTTDTFSYAASDGISSSDSGGVNIAVQVANRKPFRPEVSIRSFTTTSGVALLNMPFGVVDLDPNTTLTYNLLTQTGRGVLDISAGGTFSYTPTTGLSGLDKFYFKAYDGSLYSEPLQVDINVLGTGGGGGGGGGVGNYAPLAKNLSFTTHEDTSLVELLVATDADKDPVTYEIVSNGQKGYAGLLSTQTGAFTYTPIFNATGTDSFTYKASDGKSYSNLATVTITITNVNDAPVAANGVLEVPINTPTMGTLVASDVDQNGLTYSIVANGNKGTVVVTNSATGTYTYTPNLNATGADSFTFKVNDGAVDSNTATVTVAMPTNGSWAFINGSWTFTGGTYVGGGWTNTGGGWTYTSGVFDTSGFWTNTGGGWRYEMGVNTGQIWTNILGNWVTSSGWAGIRRASVSTTGIQGNDDSGLYHKKIESLKIRNPWCWFGDTSPWCFTMSEPSITITGGSVSADGRYVVFQSKATNLVANDTNSDWDVFVHDTQLGTTSLVSVNSLGEQAATVTVSGGSATIVGGATSTGGSISADGRYVVFESNANNLVTGSHFSSTGNVYRRDLQTGTTIRISVSSSGGQAAIITPTGSASFSVVSGATSTGGVISANGRYVLFESDANNLVANDTDDTFDLFLRDTELGTTSRVNVNSSGQQAAKLTPTGGSTSTGGFSDVGGVNTIGGALSADGRYIVFWSDANNLVPNDTNNGFDVFMRDTLLGVTTRISVDSAGNQATVSGTGGVTKTGGLAISADGRYVVFESNADNLVAGDTNQGWDVFVRDTKLNTTTRVSVNSAGEQGMLSSTAGVTVTGGVDISADGRYVVFGSHATNLVAGDTNRAFDVYLHDTVNKTTRILTNALGEQGFMDTLMDIPSISPKISANGRYVIFGSRALNLVPGDVNGASDMFVASTDSFTDSVAAATWYTDIFQLGPYKAGWTYTGGAYSGNRWILKDGSWTYTGGAGGWTYTGSVWTPTSASLVSINDVTVTEKNTESVNAVFTVTLSQPNTLGIHIKALLTGITASTYQDIPGTYQLPSSPYVISFMPGETSKSLAIPVYGDTTVEQNETFQVTLSTSDPGAIIGDGIGIGTIIDNDAIPSSYWNLTGGGWTFSGGTYTGSTWTNTGGGWTYTSGVFDTGGTWTNTGSGWFYSVGSNVGNKWIPTTNGAWTNNSVNIGTTGQSRYEGEVVTVAVSLYTTPTGMTVSIPFSVSGTATQGTDYELLTSSPLSTTGSSATISFRAKMDGLTETGETVIITLGTPTNAMLGTNTTHTVTLLDSQLPISLLPKTGQSVSYLSGDDAYWRSTVGVAWANPRFTDNADGTVTDNNTGLIWIKNADCRNGGMDWTSAVGFAATLSSGTCGLTDGSSSGQWRLPNIPELESLLDYGRSATALPSGHPFSAVQSLYYFSFWSGTTDSNNAANAWNVNLGAGYVGNGPKTDNSLRAWAVRGQPTNVTPTLKSGQTTSYLAGDDGAWQAGLAVTATGGPRFIDNGDGTVTDSVTALTWLKDANCFSQQNWSTALSSANTLANGSCGLSDGSTAGQWRIPNIRELKTLIDYGKYNPAMPNSHPFSNVQPSYYWSGSTLKSYTAYAWNVNLINGNVNPPDPGKSSSLYVWPVRGGTTTNTGSWTQTGSGPWTFTGNSSIIASRWFQPVAGSNWTLTSGVYTASGMTWTNTGAPAVTGNWTNTSGAWTYTSGVTDTGGAWTSSGGGWVYNVGKSTASRWYYSNGSWTTSNTAPSVTTFADLNVTAGTGSSVLFTVSDQESGTSGLTITTTSSNTTLIPNSSITVSGSGSYRYINFTPATGQTGSSTIQVTVSDGQTTTTRSFTVTVSASLGGGSGPSISGKAANMPFKAGASVLCSKLDGSVFVSNIVTDNTGAFTCPSISWTGPTLVEVAGAMISATGGGAATNTGTVRLITRMEGSSKTVNVNTLTTMAAPIIQNAIMAVSATGGAAGIDQLIASASNMVVAKVFGTGYALPDNVKLEDLNPLEDSTGNTLKDMLNANLLVFDYKLDKVGNDYPSNPLAQMAGSLWENGQLTQTGYFAQMVQTTASDLLTRLSDLGSALGLSSYFTTTNSQVNAALSATGGIIAPSTFQASAVTAGEKLPPVFTFTATGGGISQSGGTVTLNLSYPGAANDAFNLAGTDGHGGAVTITPNIVTVSNGLTAASAVVTYVPTSTWVNAPGLVTVTATKATDSSIATTTVIPYTALAVNHAPTIKAGTFKTDGSITLDLSAISTDEDGDRLTYHITTPITRTGGYTPAIGWGKGFSSAVSSWTPTFGNGVTFSNGYVGLISKSGELSLLTPSGGMSFTGSSKLAGTLGTLELSNGKVTYTRPGYGTTLSGIGFTGTFGFGYAVIDSRGYGRMETIDLGVSSTFTNTNASTGDPNSAPSSISLSGKTLAPSSGSSSVTFTVSDPDGSADALTVTATSSDTTLVPNGNIVVSGSGSSRTVTFTPATGQVGSATITVTVSDGQSSTTGTFIVTVAKPIIPKTGQTTSYATGDDGALQKGVAWASPRFTDNNNGTITDNNTGLIWLKNANCFNTQNWATAIASSNSLASGSCGLTDGSTAGQWRLPNRFEMKSLVDRSRFSPALPSGHPFSGVQSNGYWSSSTVATNSSNAWFVYLYDGDVVVNDKSDTYYVWPVRGGQ